MSLLTTTLFSIVAFVSAYFLKGKYDWWYYNWYPLASLMCYNPAYVLLRNLFTVVLFGVGCVLCAYAGTSSWFVIAGSIVLGVAAARFVMYWRF